MAEKFATWCHIAGPQRAFICERSTKAIGDMAMQAAANASVNEEDDDPVTTDLVVLGRARVVMQQLLLRCVEDPLDEDALRRAYDVQVMLRADLTAVQRRLKAVLACV